MTTDQVPPATGALAVGVSPPDSDGPAGDIAAYFADHHGGHLANTFLV